MENKYSLWKGVLSVATLGTVKFTHNNSVKLADPITGIAENFIQVSQHRKNLNEGVWIGTRPLGKSGVMVKSVLLKQFSTQIGHQAVRVNGITYSLTIQDGKKIEIEWDDDTDYDWIYSGKSKVTDAEMKKYVKQINKKQQKYLFVGRNCQTISNELENYANGKTADKEYRKLVYETEEHVNYTDYGECCYDFYARD
eukprot:403364596